MRALIRYLGRHHWGILAAFIALGGTAYATSQLPPNSVGTRQLRRHAVTLSKISPAAQDRLRGRTGRTGRTGPAGPTGPSDGYAAQSPPPGGGLGPVSSSLILPPGDYSVTGQCQASIEDVGSSHSLAFGLADEELSIGPLAQATNANGDLLGGARGSVPNEGETAISVGNPVHYGETPLIYTTLVSLPRGGTIYDTCENGVGAPGAAGGSTLTDIGYTAPYITAIRLGALHGTIPTGSDG